MNIYLSTPGEILKEEFLDEFNISAYKLSKSINYSRSSIAKILNGERAITSDLAVKLEKYFGVSAEFWLNLQQQWDIENSRKAMKEELGNIKSLKIAV